MGNWAMHIEGHGIHDNGRPDDADALMHDFVQELAAKGHQVSSATIHVGVGKRVSAMPDSTYEPLP